jgi:CubicO group peptidase (beta-lactamase class C family)
MNQKLQRRVQQLIDDLIETGEEVGLQVAAYLDGEPLVDAWAGIADEASGRPVDGETLFTSWSTTKGFVATCVHILAERGLLDYDAPIARYWPEFGANGKAAATVRHALTHMAGVPQLPADVTPELMTDWDAMCAAIARQAPLWEPGTKAGYHAWTFGWINGEIVRRVDGRPLAQFAREELCEPLGIRDFYLGIPDEAEPRVATLRQDPLHLAGSMQQDELGQRVMPPQVTSAAVVNRPDVRRASIPGGGGIMSARAIARHYAMLACGGALGGVRMLSPQRIEIVRTLRPVLRDELFGGPGRVGLGYALGGDPAQGGDAAMGSGGGEFGHGGNGGSLGFADPARRLSFGLTKNLMRAVPDARQAAAYRVAELIRAHLGRARSSSSAVSPAAGVCGLE